MSQSVRTKSKPPRPGGPPEGERTARLEERMEHLATKADLERLGGEIKSDLAKTESRILRWMAGVIISVGALVAAFVKFL